MSKGTWLLTVVVAALVAFSAQAISHRLDLRPKKAPRLMTAASPTSGEKGVLRTSSLAAGATRIDGLAVGDELEFLLFDDVALTVRLVERTQSPLGGAAFLATVGGYAGIRNAVVCQTADGLQVSMEDFRSGKTYTVFSSAERTVVRETDPSAVEVIPSRPVESVRVSRSGGLAVNALESGAPAVSGSGETFVDVLVAYDANAAVWTRREGGGLTNFALVAVQKMNAALGNSGLDSDFRFRLVGVTELAVSTNVVRGALYAIDGDRPGWADLRTKRDEFGADIVTTLIDTGSSAGNTGVGFSLTQGNRKTFGEQAYNVCAVRSVAISHTMTHEFGHNLGAGHATAVNPDYCDPGPQYFADSAGYYFSAAGKNYGTVMTYDSDGYGKSYVVVPVFSSPDNTWEGVAVGDSEHNNVRALRATFVTASNWRGTVVSAAHTISFSPASGTLFDDEVGVTLAADAEGVEIRYTLDGSMPTANSSLYNGLIVLKSTATIRAVAIKDGHAGFVHEATYYAQTLGTGLDAPQLEWTTGSDYPWSFQADRTHDGACAVESYCLTNMHRGGESWLRTSVTGPTMMSFWYSKTMYHGNFTVTVDNVKRFSDTADGVESDWELVEIEIPDGKHVVTFTAKYGGGWHGGVFNGIWLDQVRFDAYSRPPTLMPETSTDESTAVRFTNEMTVVLAPPGRDGVLYYTIDGTDPTLAGARLYDGPITLTGSTLVRSVFVEPGMGPSREAKGLYLERHPPQAGEWVTDVEGVKAAAKQGGRLIAVLFANRLGCGLTQRLLPIVQDERFLDWARMNGVYLLMADTIALPDCKEAYDYYWKLYRQTELHARKPNSSYYATMVFATPDESDTAIVAAMAHRGEIVGDVQYDETVESLVAGLASVMGVSGVPAAPVASPDTELVGGYPVTVTLTNPNASGTIYYTLDGSAPTKVNGMRYETSVLITSPGVILKAAVWNASGLSSPVLVKSYRSISEWANGIFGTSGIIWQKEGSVEWTEAAGDRTLRTGGLLSGSPYVSTLKATVTGKGKFVFTYKGCTWGNKNSVTYSLNGTVQKTIRGYCTSGAQGETVTKVIDTDGTTTFAWAYDVAEPGCDLTSGYTYEGVRIWCGVWLSDVQWIPDRKPEAHTVTFDLGEHGTRVGGGELEQTVAHGEAAVAPTVKADVGWAFDGWDIAFTNVTGDLTVKAEYSAVLPPLPSEPTTEDVRQALEGVADPKLQECITEPDEYDEFREWAGKVKDDGGREPAGVQAVCDSPNAWLSYALASDRLVAAAPEDGDLKVDEFKPTATDDATSGSFDITVSVENLPVGDDARPENLARVFGIDGGSSLTDLSADKVAIEFGTPENGKVKLIARPKGEVPTAFFMRVKMRP